MASFRGTRARAEVREDQVTEELEAASFRWENGGEANDYLRQGHGELATGVGEHSSAVDFVHFPQRSTSHDTQEVARIVSCMITVS